MLLAFVLFFPLCGEGAASDFKFAPRVSTTAEYNDNVEEEKGGKGDFLWIVKPGLNATYDHARVFLDLSYDFEFKKYMDQVLGDEQNHDLDATAKIEAIKELFFIEVTDTFKKVFTDTARGDVPDGDTSADTTDQNIFAIKPYFVIPLRERTTLTTGGEFKDIWYSEDDSVDKRNYILFADVEHELTEQWLLTGGAGYEKQDPRWEEGGFDRYNLAIGTRYSYAEDSYIEANWEPTYTDFAVEGSSDKHYNPYLLGITHAFTKTLTGKASSAMEFSEDPQSSDTENKFVHQVGLESEYERGNVSVTLAYYDYENSTSISRRTYWRPGFTGLHNLSERLALNYNAYIDFHTNPESERYLFALMGLRYSLSERTSASLSYRLKSNDEEGSATDYTSNSIGLTLSWAH